MYKQWRRFHVSKKGADSLYLVILHQACQMMQVRLQLDFFVTQVVQMLLQVGNVGFEHHVDVRAGGGLFLQKFPLGFKHFVLLFQEPYLRGEMPIYVENDNIKLVLHFYIDICLGLSYF